jgi:hypothetical protein
MNEHGKSDSPIVPEKLPNKFAEQANTEAAEGSGLTKGNGTRQNMLQTQSWEGVKSALGLVHRRAKEDKKAQFTALMHHIYNVNTLDVRSNEFRPVLSNEFMPRREIKYFTSSENWISKRLADTAIGGRR